MQQTWESSAAVSQLMAPLLIPTLGSTLERGGASKPSPMFEERASSFVTNAVPHCMHCGRHIQHIWNAICEDLKTSPQGSSEVRGGGRRLRWGWLFRI